MVIKPEKSVHVATGQKSTSPPPKGSSKVSGQNYSDLYRLVMVELIPVCMTEGLKWYPMEVESCTSKAILTVHVVHVAIIESYIIVLWCVSCRKLRRNSTFNCISACFNALCLYVVDMKL